MCMNCLPAVKGNYPAAPELSAPIALSVISLFRKSFELF